MIVWKNKHQYIMKKLMTLMSRLFLLKKKKKNSHDSQMSFEINGLKWFKKQFNNIKDTHLKQKFVVLNGNYIFFF